MYKLDVQDVLRDGRQAVAGIGCPATIELTDSDQALPGSFLIIDEQEPECCNGSIVVSTMADDVSPIPISRLVVAVVVGAIVSL